MSVGASVFATSVYVPSLLEERPVFVRERQAASYRVSSYTIYKLLNEALGGLVGVLLSTPVVYWACGLRRAPQAFFFFMLAMWVINLASSCITMFVAASSKSVEVGGSVVPLLMVSACGGCAGRGGRSDSQNNRRATSSPPGS